MNTRISVVSPEEVAHGGTEPKGGLAEEQARRAGVYSLVAALLRNPPDEQLLAYTGGLASRPEGNADELLTSLSMLALAAGRCSPEALSEEYHQLFIGLARGELVPYGSWYQTGFLMERPLGVLRDDLAALGFERQEDIHEPEDHIAALCEVMALLIQEEAPIEEQTRFFSAHLAPWVNRFFEDLATARSAVFYKSVARFAQAFLALEREYLSLPT